jgi:hypothetical protein
MPQASHGPMSNSARKVEETIWVVSCARRTGLLLVATMLWLAVIEHWLLVLPLESTALWRWAMRHAQERGQQEAPSAVKLEARTAP